MLALSIVPGVYSFASIRAHAADSAEAIAIHGTVAAVVSETPVGFAMLDVRSAVTSHLTLTAALAHLDPAGASEEQQLRLGVIARLPLRRWEFDDRVLWVRAGAGREYWRNQLRLTYPIFLGTRPARLLIFDEIYGAEGRGLFRNNVAAGMSLGVGKRTSIELSYMYADNRQGRTTNSLLLVASVRIR